jgi:hypothetical protein
VVVAVVVVCVVVTVCVSVDVVGGPRETSIRTFAPRSTFWFGAGL